MDFLTLAKQRCSVRDYQEKEVEQEKIDLILEAGNVAPTACNKQPQRILVLQGKEDMEKLESVYRTFHAPMAFLICTNHEEVWKRAYDGKTSSDIDASIVCDHMMLEAASLGLGSVWVCNFDPAKMKEVFALPEHVEPINLLLVGYGKEGTQKEENRHATQRKEVKEVLL